MPHCWKSHVAAKLVWCSGVYVFHKHLVFIPRRSRRDIVLALSLHPSVHSLRPQFLSVRNHISVPLVRFDSFMVKMRSTMDSRYLISFVKIEPLTLSNILDRRLLWSEWYRTWTSGLVKWDLCFVIYIFLSINPSSGDINSSNLSCSRLKAGRPQSLGSSREEHTWSSTESSGYGTDSSCKNRIPVPKANSFGGMGSFIYSHLKSPMRGGSLSKAGQCQLHRLR